MYFSKPKHIKQKMKCIKAIPIISKSCKPESYHLNWTPKSETLIFLGLRLRLRNSGIKSNFSKNNKCIVLATRKILFFRIRRRILSSIEMISK